MYWATVTHSSGCRSGVDTRGIQWAHLDETLSSQVRILLGDCDAESIEIPEHLKIRGSDRLRLYRSVAEHLFTKDEFAATNRALDQVANVRQHRERLRFRA